LKKSSTTTIPNNVSGDQTFKPYLDRVVNKDIQGKVEYVIPYSLPNSPPYTGPRTGIKDIATGTAVKIISYKESTGVFGNGYYTVMVNGGMAQIIKSDISIKSIISPNDLVDKIIDYAPPIDTKSPPVSTGNGATEIIDTTIKPDYTAPAPTPDPTAGIIKPPLPPDEYQAYKPPLFGIIKINQFYLVVNGQAGTWLKAGNNVRITGRKKHYANISTGAVVSTDLYEILFLGVTGFIPVDYLTVTEDPLVTANVEAFTGIEKYMPVLQAKTNKAATIYKAAGTTTNLAAGTAIQLTGRGTVRTNRFGAWQTIPVYTCMANASQWLIAVADVNV